MDVNVNKSYISVPMIADRFPLMAHISFRFYGRCYFGSFEVAAPVKLLCPGGAVNDN